MEGCAVLPGWECRPPGRVQAVPTWFLGTPSQRFSKEFGKQRLVNHSVHIEMINMGICDLIGTFT
jgi:hypothetical protein